MIKRIKLSISDRVRRFRFILSSTNNPLFIGYYRYFYKPEKGSISEFLNEYSLSKTNKFSVVQIGANDGITNDLIHKFIKRDKWTAVLLEPQPRAIIFENARLSVKDTDLCLKNLRENNYAIRKFGGDTFAMRRPLEHFSKYFRDTE